MAKGYYRSLVKFFGLIVLGLFTLGTYTFFAINYIPRKIKDRRNK